MRVIQNDRIRDKGARWEPAELTAVVDHRRLQTEDTLNMAFSVMNNRQKQKFKDSFDVDVAYSVPGLGRFRCNVFQQRGTVGLVLRVIPMTIRTIEELGSELIVHLNVDAARIDSGDPDAVEDLGSAANAVAKFEAASGVREGESIALAVDAAKLHLFDAATRLAI